MTEDQAAVRRAARKRARLDVAPPEPAPEFESLSLDDLRADRQALTDYETRVSYWRRILQARLDLVMTGEATTEGLAGLADALADAPSITKRIARLSILPPDQVPPLPDLVELWRYQPETEQDTYVYTERLREREQQLSEFRRTLHVKIDELQRELIARYRQNPSLALTALPNRSSESAG